MCVSVHVCARLHACVFWTDTMRACCKYMQYKPYYCDFSCCKCVCAYAAVCSVVHKCTCKSVRFCMWGWRWERMCNPPPAGTIITARAHSRQLSPGGPWLRPAWRDAAWLTVEPGSALPPPSHTHTLTQTCNIMMHAHRTSHLFYSITMKKEHACAHVEILLKKTHKWTLYYGRTGAFLHCLIVVSTRAHVWLFVLCCVYGKRCFVQGMRSSCVNPCNGSLGMMWKWWKTGMPSMHLSGHKTA